MCKHSYFPHLPQFTISFSNGILLKLPTYCPHLMTISILLKTLGGWQQSIQDEQRKQRPMQDMIRLQKICGTIIGGYLEKEICELFCCHSSPNIMKCKCLHSSKYNNKIRRKEYKVSRSPCNQTTSSPSSSIPSTTYFMSINCFFTHNL